MNSQQDMPVTDPQHETTQQAIYETPALTYLGKVGDLTLGVPGAPQVDVLFVGSL